MKTVGLPRAGRRVTKQRVLVRPAHLPFVMNCAMAVEDRNRITSPYAFRIPETVHSHLVGRLRRCSECRASKFAVGYRDPSLATTHWRCTMPGVNARWKGAVVCCGRWHLAWLADLQRGLAHLGGPGAWSSRPHIGHRGWPARSSCVEVCISAVCRRDLGQLRCHGVEDVSPEGLSGQGILHRWRRRVDRL